MNCQGNDYICSFFIFLKQNLSVLKLYYSPFTTCFPLPFLSSSLLSFPFLFLHLQFCSHPTLRPFHPHRLLGSHTFPPHHKWVFWVLYISSRRISCPHGDHFTPLHNTVLISSETNKQQWRDSTLRPSSPLSSAVCLDQCGLITSRSNNAPLLASFPHKNLLFLTVHSNTLILQH